MINLEQEKLELDSLPEFIREPYVPATEAAKPASGVMAGIASVASSAASLYAGGGASINLPGGSGPTAHSKANFRKAAQQQVAPQPVAAQPVAAQTFAAQTTTKQLNKKSYADRLADLMEEEHAETVREHRERERRPAQQMPVVDPITHKSAELDTLWPGIHVNPEMFQQYNRRKPSFYIMLGFMAGAVVSLVSAWTYSCFVHPGDTVASGPAPVQTKSLDESKARETGAASMASNPSNSQPTTVATSNGGELIKPADAVYEVRNGDSLALIAMREYKRVSPRLMDHICRANGMRNADVLSLGQKIKLPEYTTQSTQIATGGSSRLQ